MKGKIVKTKTTLQVIEFAHTNLKRSIYLPLAQLALFILLITTIASEIFKIGKTTFWPALTRLFGEVWKHRPRMRSFGPEWEKFRKKVAPYIEFVGSIYFAIIGAYSGIVVGIAFSISFAGNAWWVNSIAVAWCIASYSYMRWNLIEASWAYHQIKANS